MIRVSNKDLGRLREEIEQIGLSAFWLETYAMGLEERARRMKKFLLDLQTVTIVEKPPQASANAARGGE